MTLSLLIVGIYEPIKPFAIETNVRLTANVDFGRGIISNYLKDLPVSFVCVLNIHSCKLR